MIIVTTENIPGKEIKEVFGFVSVRTKNIGKDIGAGFKTLVGGEIKAYQEMMEESRKIAIGRMVEKAEAMGANAIVGMKIGTSAIMQGASEVIAYGTAVLIEEKLREIDFDGNDSIYCTILWCNNNWINNFINTKNY